MAPSTDKNQKTGISESWCFFDGRNQNARNNNSAGNIQIREHKR